MLSGVPNFAFAVGYTNASWTLKVDLVCDYVCRLISYMQRHAHDTCVPVNGDPSMPTRPLLDFEAGYVQRAVADFPRQGTGPWRVVMSYREDVRSLRGEQPDDGVLRFSPAGEKRAQALFELPDEPQQAGAPFAGSTAESGVAAGTEAA